MVLKLWQICVALVNRVDIRLPQILSTIRQVGPKSPTFCLEVIIVEAVSELLTFLQTRRQSYTRDGV